MKSKIKSLILKILNLTTRFYAVKQAEISQETNSSYSIENQAKNDVRDVMAVMLIFFTKIKCRSGKTFLERQSALT